MSTVRDLFSLLAGCVGLFAAAEPRAFWIVFLAGILLAAACWMGCLYFSRLWNLTFHMSATHHLLAGFAALFTLLFTVLFASLKYTREAAIVSIDLWQRQISSDEAWSNQAFGRAYEAVKRLNVEDFSQFPPPEAGGHTIPVKHDESRKLTAATYAKGACEHFDHQRPLLSTIVRPDVPLQRVYEDQRDWFNQHPDSTYDLARAISLAASEIKSELIPQTPRVILVSRLVAVLGLVMIQALPFGLIARSAYNDLKVTT
jgi:hypothetical protein